MRGPWTENSSRQSLDDVRLDEDVEAEGQCGATRPEQLQGVMHELALVLVMAFIGATFLILQRGTVVISDTVRHSLGMDTVATSWITSSSGQVYQPSLQNSPRLTLLVFQPRSRHLLATNCSDSRLRPHRFPQIHSDRQPCCVLPRYGLHYFLPQRYSIRHHAWCGRPRLSSSRPNRFQPLGFHLHCSLYEKTVRFHVLPSRR